MININHDPYPDQVIWCSIILIDGFIKNLNDKHNNSDNL